MAKQLLIVRHAKSDWGNAGLRDFDRPLNKRGKANAPEMAERLANAKIVPELIISSPALRALTTARFFADTWQISLNDIKQEQEIYEANVNTLVKIVNGLPNQYQKIALFGHNPGFSDLATYLNGHVHEMPTCGVILLEFPFDDWAMLSEATASVILYDYPKSGDD